MDFLNGNTFPSSCSEGGFELQKQLMLYCCAKLRKMKCQKFSVGYEVDHFTKFDDVVCRFEWNGKNYLIPIQAKFVLDDKKTIKKDDLERAKGRFNLNDYIKGIMEFKKDLPDNTEVRFIIATTSPMNGYSAPILKANEPTLPVTQEIVLNLFDELQKNESSELYLIKEEFSDNFRETMENIMKDKKEARKNLDYIFHRLLFLTKMPKEEKFLQIIKDFLFLNDVNVVNKETFFEVIQKRTTNYVEFDKATKKRKALNETTFEVLLRGSVVEADFQGISDSFLSETKLSIEFESQFLEELWQKLQNALKFIKCERNKNSTALRVLHSIKMAHEDAILVPISKLKDFHIECLKFYGENERTIVVLVDKEMQQNALVEKANIYYVGKIEGLSSSAELPPFSYDELTRNAKQEFEEKIIKIQDFQLKLKQIPNNESKEYKAIMEKFFGFFCDKKAIKIGEKLPDNPYPSIERQYKLEEGVFIPENKILAKFSKCIIKSHRGENDSLTLQKMARKFKQEYPHFWVECIEMNLLGDYVKELKNEGMSFTEIEAKDFLLDEILSFKENSLLLDRELVEYYLTLAYPPIILIFNGFDEITQTYSKDVLNLIRKMIRLRVKIVISGQPNSETTSKEFRDFTEIQICEYSEDQCKSLVQHYKIKKRSSLRLTKNLFPPFNKMLDMMISNSDWLQRKLLSNISSHMQGNSRNDEGRLQENHQFDILGIYNKILELSNFREMENTHQAANEVLERQKINSAANEITEKAEKEVVREKEEIKENERIDPTPNKIIENEEKKEVIERENTDQAGNCAMEREEKEKEDSVGRRIGKEAERSINRIAKNFTKKKITKFFKKI